MRSIILSLLLVLILPNQAKAQSLNDLIGTGCQVAGNIAGYEWICQLSYYVQNGERVLEDIHQDFAGFSEDMLKLWFEDALSTVANEVGLSEFNTFFSDLDVALSQGPREVKDALRGVTDSLRLSHAASQRSERLAPALAQLQNPENLVSSDVLVDVAETSNPNIRAASELNYSERLRMIGVQVEAEAAHKMNEDLAQSLLEDSSVRDAAANVLRPSIGGIGGGSASQLEDRARTAVSTRAVMGVLTEGLAELMRQEATFNTAIAEELKLLAQQQVMTSWQLKLTVDSISARYSRELEKEMAEMEAEIASSYDQGVQASRTLGAALSSVAATANDPFPFQTYASLGF